jgi:hypothetical protein
MWFDVGRRAMSSMDCPPMLNELQEQTRWLSRYASNVTSTTGEDGIIAKVLSLLPQRTSWCVEFGAWDGKLYSNTYDLVRSHDYRGVFIEAIRSDLVI